MHKNDEKHIAIFRGKEIRKTIHKNEWWFSVADVVEVLTDSADPRQSRAALGVIRRIAELPRRSCLLPLLPI